jgi:hypothetical protein
VAPGDATRASARARPGDHLAATQALEITGCLFDVPQSFAEPRLLFLLHDHLPQVDDVAPGDPPQLGRATGPRLDKSCVSRKPQLAWRPSSVSSGKCRGWDGPGGPSSVSSGK